MIYPLYKCPTGASASHRLSPAILTSLPSRHFLCLYCMLFLKSQGPVFSLGKMIALNKPMWYLRFTICFMTTQQVGSTPYQDVTYRKLNLSPSFPSLFFLSLHYTITCNIDLTPTCSLTLLTLRSFSSKHCKSLTYFLASGPFLPFSDESESTVELGLTSAVPTAL